MCLLCTHQPASRWLGPLTPTAGTPTSARVPLRFCPCLHNCHQATLRCPVPLSGVELPTELLSSSGTLSRRYSPLSIHWTSLLLVTFGSLPFPLPLGESPLPRLTSAPSCLALMPPPDALSLWPTPALMNSTPRHWAKPTGPFPPGLSPRVRSVCSLSEGSSRLSHSKSPGSSPLAACLHSASPLPPSNTGGYDVLGTSGVRAITMDLMFY